MKKNILLFCLVMMFSSSGLAEDWDSGCSVHQS